MNSFMAIRSPLYDYSLLSNTFPACTNQRLSSSNFSSVGRESAPSSVDGNIPSPEFKLKPAVFFPKLARQRGEFFAPLLQFQSTREGFRSEFFDEMTEVENSLGALTKNYQKQNLMQVCIVTKLGHDLRKVYTFSCDEFSRFLRTGKLNSICAFTDNKVQDKQGGR